MPVTTPPLGDELAAATDHALARRAGLGDRAAFQELFGRLFPATLRFATRMLDGDERAAEDAVQDAWIKAWRGLPDFRGTSAVQTWLFTIVQREVVERRRRRRPWRCRRRRRTRRSPSPRGPGRAWGAGDGVA